MELPAVPVAELVCVPEALAWCGDGLAAFALAAPILSLAFGFGTAAARGTNAAGAEGRAVPGRAGALLDVAPVLGVST